MGILADLFVAHPDDAVAYEERLGSRSARFEVRQFNGFTQLELEILWAMVAGEEWSPERHQLEAIGEPSESWLFRFPDAFVGRLASLGPDLHPLASRWAAIEELACAPDEIKPVLEALVSLAKSAQKNGKGLFLWGSL